MDIDILCIADYAQCWQINLPTKHGYATSEGEKLILKSNISWYSLYYLENFTEADRILDHALRANDAAISWWKTNEHN